MPQPPPTAGLPLGRAEDPDPLLTRTADALDRYRRALRETVPGAAGDGFRQAVRGLRAGIVIDGESVWLYEEEAGRWMYADGSRLTTYAVVSEPGAPPAAEPAPPPEPAPEPEPEPEESGAGAVAGVREAPHEPTRVADRPDGGGSP